jgi:surfactin synthase thioesterase subunit
VSGVRERVKLYCIPYAGGSANVFLAWKHRLDISIELVPVELSGRGGRIRSPLLESFDRVLEDVLSEVTRTPAPASYALFGHSFGGLLAFELAHELMARGRDAPRHLFVSATSPPQRAQERILSLVDERRLRADDRELLGSLAHLGGVPSEILDDDEAVQLFAPILRADLRALFGYRHVSQAKLRCDISILLGSNDTMATETDAQLWSALTTGSVATRLFEGGHFAALERPADVVWLVNETLCAPAGKQ